MKIWANIIIFNTYKVLIAKIVGKNLKLEQIDVVFVYFYKCLDKNEIIYIKLPLKYLTNNKILLYYLI